MTTTPRTSLEKRKSPVQARAQHRVQLILASTRALLREEGLAAVTTTAIANRAGIPVSSLYQYYPNKKAILMALYEDYLAKVRELFSRYDQPKYLEQGWQSFITLLFGQIHRAELRDEIENELEKALVIYPELAEIDRQHREKIAVIMVELLRKLGSRWSRAKLRRLALYGYSLNSGVWYYRAEVKPRAKELIEWNMEVTHAVLGQCFE